MQARMLLVTGFVCLWASVVIIPCGMYLATKSSNFPEYERHVMAELSASGPDSPGLFGPDAAWFFAIFFCLLIGLLFTYGVAIVHGLTLWKRRVGLLAAGVFGIGCFVGSLFSIRCAFESLQWGFLVEGLSGLLSACGLACGAIGTFRSCRTLSFGVRRAI